MLELAHRHPAFTRENTLPLSSAAEGVSQSVCYCMFLLVLPCCSAFLSPQRLNTAEEFYLNPASALWGHRLLLELPSVFKTHKSKLGWAEWGWQKVVRSAYWKNVTISFLWRRLFRPVLVSHTLYQSWSLPPAGRNALDLSWCCQSFWSWTFSLPFCSRVDFCVLVLILKISWWIWIQFYPVFIMALLWEPQVFTLHQQLLFWGSLFLSPPCHAFFFSSDFILFYFILFYFLFFLLLGVDLFY